MVINGAVFEWAAVISGVPQGSIHGSVPFIIYITDIDVGFINFISKFVDDAKIGNSVLSDEDVCKISASHGK